MVLSCCRLSQRTPVANLSALTPDIGASGTSVLLKSEQKGADFLSRTQAAAIRFASMSIVLHEQQSADSRIEGIVAEQSVSHEESGRRGRRVDSAGADR